MDDAELERLAVKELLREAEAHSTNSTVKERKLNPTIIKPNKTFLGRTLNSVMAHNKREDDRAQKNCRNKLRALEERRRKRLQRKYNDEKQKQGRSTSKESGSAYEIFSSSDNETKNAENKQLTHKARHKSASRRNKRRRHSSSSSSSKLMEAQGSQNDQDEYYSQCFDQLAAYALASKSYYQVGKWLCYQALLAGTAENFEQPNLEELFNMNRLENYENNNNNNNDDNNDTICLSSGDEEDGISNCELSFLEDTDSLISVDSDTKNDIESAALPENAVECQLIDEELSGLQSNPPDADTIELSDSSCDDQDGDPRNDDDDDDIDDIDGVENKNSYPKANKSVSIDLTSD